MKGYWCRVASLGVAVLAARAAGAQDTSAPVQAVPRCFHLERGEWSRPLGVNGEYHVLPTTVRLDTARTLRRGWKVVPDIDFPTRNHFRDDWPYWTWQADTLEIVWSNGFQATIVHLLKSIGEELRGTVTVQSDANEFGRKPPRASIRARPISCTAPPV